jgi:ParB-like chromosome segregation protein Spo0J
MSAHAGNTPHAAPDQTDRPKHQCFRLLIPIVIDEADRVLVGLGRFDAARNLGFAEVPTIQVTHLSEAQKKAFAIADNRLAEIPRWDDPASG